MRLALLFILAFLVTSCNSLSEEKIKTAKSQAASQRINSKASDADKELNDL